MIPTAKLSVVGGLTPPRCFYLPWGHTGKEEGSSQGSLLSQEETGFAFSPVLFLLVWGCFEDDDDG